MKTETDVKAGALSLATTSTSDMSAAGSCDPNATCTLAANTPLTYPVAIPAGTTAPIAVKIQTAMLNSGLGNQTWTHSMQLTIPANTKAAAYTSTWIYSLVSGP